MFSIKVWTGLVSPQLVAGHPLSVSTHGHSSWHAYLASPPLLIRTPVLLH